VGDPVVNRDHRHTQPLNAQHRDEVFYEGEIAHAIVEDMRKHDGLIAAEDLRGWRTTRNAPLWGTYRRYRVSSNRPPGGGVMLLEMLNILEHFPLASLDHNSAEYMRLVAEAM
jgi:gamma-glutamyltranspeptidase/glutathione hydrolase